MVRQSRSNSKTYRTSNDAPETPLTPHTPRSPHLHRSRLLASTPSRPALKRQHTEDFDTDMGPASAKLAQLPNANPTPSEILSMDLNTLALSGSNHRSMMATPSSRLSDDAIERFNLTLPFARLSSSSSSPQPSSSRVVSRSSLESVHRTPVRESAQEQQQYSYQYQQQQQQHYAPSTPVSSKVAYNNSSNNNKDRLATPPNSSMAQQRSVLISPPRSQPIADEENNVFLARSPRAIRTPRRSLGKAHQLAMTRQSAAEKPAPLSDTIMHTTSTPTTTMTPHTSESSSMTMGTLQGDSIYVDPSEEDTVETESVQSSQGGDLEKENHTPKIMECDPSNPFLVMESKRPLPSRTTATASSASHSKNEGCTTPTGPPSGSITRSRRLALGSISPWRWNTFDEHTSLLALANLKGHSSSTKGLGLDGAFCGAYSKPDPAVSEWVESTQHHKGHHPASEAAAAVSGNGASDSLSTTASSSSSSAASSSASSSSTGATPTAGSKSRSGTGSKFITSSASLFGPPISAKGKLPDHHPNSAEAAAERKAGPASSIVAKLTENVIQPHSVAFNRRAQQVAGRIYYWKHGSYHLVSDQDKQQWPGEWKFEVFQDPESPGATMSCTAQQGESSSSSGGSGSSTGGGITGGGGSSSSNNNSHSLYAGSSSSSSAVASAPYHGKGKLTDRQLSGPASKRLRVHREPLAGFNEASSVVASSNPLQQQHQQQQQQHQADAEVSGIASAATTTPRTSSSRSNGLLTGERDHHHHRYPHGTPPPPSSPSRRAATRLRQDANRSSKQSRLQDRYDFRERRMLNEPLAQRPRRCGA
ncbi:hypothetical protein BGZ68_004659 [Mortierella alpina]|nr:hypothetical protein BGZ68_004659 [Mortierella alpina]